MNSLKTTSPIALSPANEESKQYNNTSSFLSCEENSSSYDRTNYQKNECIMKSPLTVYNHCHVKGVLQNAYFMRQEMELQARALKALTGIYIRPIILFVLKNQTSYSETDLKRIKQEFINSGLPEAETKLKTNDTDELSEMDLQNENCEVRYVITTSNSNMTWECPFAYIIASLENRNNACDLSNVLNYILPLPGNITNNHHPFNTGYILLASSKFTSCIEFIKKHLKSLNLGNQNLILQDNMIELLKDMSLWDVLAKENEDIKGVQFGEGKRVFSL